MAISVVGATQGSGLSGTASSFPAGWQVGDVAYLALQCGAGTQVFDPPSGWTLMLFDDQAFSKDAYCWRRVLQTGDVAPTLSVSSGSTSTSSPWGMVVFRGVDQTTPEDGSAAVGGTGGANVATSPDLAVSSIGDVFLAWYTTNVSTSGTPQAGATEYVDLTPGAVTLAMTVSGPWNGGTTGVESYTFASSAARRGDGVLVKAEATPAGPGEPVLPTTGAAAMQRSSLW